MVLVRMDENAEPQSVTLEEYQASASKPKKERKTKSNTRAKKSSSKKVGAKATSRKKTSKKKKRTALTQAGPKPKKVRKDPVPPTRVSTRLSRARRRTN